jgi:RNA polymerase sigma-70 factor (ECF subfamily)
LSTELAIYQTQDEVEDLETRFRSFVFEHRDRAIGMAWRLVGGDQAAAEDIVHDALLNAYKALPRFREEASLNTWFYRILVRQAANYRRWRGIRTFWNSPDEHDPADPRPQPTRDPLLQQRIIAAMEALTRRQREAFILVHLEGQTIRESAELMGLPQGTLKSHLHRALIKLRERLRDEIVAEVPGPGRRSNERQGRHDDSN